ncbi:limb region 1 protein homolog isoform X7 [Myotis daubentonii]|uniref:limb region 1 protein homolog isoform X7 n=1 Tax=Myotis daubentonii TaxID=98922 RepID=UPI002872F3FC|nr:limb region 1 protein homolog isoform X7 [Myotis daubentonii]
MEAQDEVSAREQHFHSQVRESTVVSVHVHTRSVRWGCAALTLLHHQQRNPTFLSSQLLYSVAQWLPDPWDSEPESWRRWSCSCSWRCWSWGWCGWPPRSWTRMRRAGSLCTISGSSTCPICTLVYHSWDVCCFSILEDLDEQMYIVALEEEALQRRLAGLSSPVDYSVVELEQELENVKIFKKKLERRKKASAWERNLVYPAVMVLLLIETSISVLLVACNILCLLVDETAMPKGTRGPGIGNASLSAFGFVGAALEIILIFYLMVSSVVGFYSLRFFGDFIPKKDDTTMTKIIGNCVSLLVLSSALPVMSRTLGITRFDLLGDFGRFNWLGNFYIVLSYNLLFAVVTTLCLVRKFTSAVREELLKALGLHKLHLSRAPRESDTAKPSANGHQKAL